MATTPTASVCSIAAHPGGVLVSAVVGAGPGAGPHVRRADGGTMAVDDWQAAATGWVPLPVTIVAADPDKAGAIPAVSIDIGAAGNASRRGSGSACAARPRRGKASLSEFHFTVSALPTWSCSVTGTPAAPVFTVGLLLPAVQKIRDASSGMATGRRQHMPIKLTTEIAARGAVGATLAACTADGRTTGWDLKTNTAK